MSASRRCRDCSAAYLGVSRSTWRKSRDYSAAYLGVSMSASRRCRDCSAAYLGESRSTRKKGIFLQHIQEYLGVIGVPGEDLGIALQHIWEYLGVPGVDLGIALEHIWEYLGVPEEDLVIALQHIWEYLEVPEEDLGIALQHIWEYHRSLEQWLPTLYSAEYFHSFINLSLDIATANYLCHNATSLPQLMTLQLLKLGFYALVCENLFIGLHFRLSQKNCSQQLINSRTYD